MATTAHCRNCGHPIEHPLPQLGPDDHLCPRCDNPTTGIQPRPGRDARGTRDTGDPGGPPLDDADRYMSFGR